MRFILGLILVVVLAYFSPLVLPWWSIAFLAALVGFGVGANWWQSFIYGLVGTAAVWGVYTFMVNQANEGILSERMSEVFNVDGGLLMVVITIAMGALLAAFGAMSGSLLRDGILPIERGAKGKKGRNKRRRFQR